MVQHDVNSHPAELSEEPVEEGKSNEQKTRSLGVGSGCVKEVKGIQSPVNLGWGVGLCDPVLPRVLSVVTW